MNRPIPSKHINGDLDLLPWPTYCSWLEWQLWPKSSYYHDLVLEKMAPNLEAILLTA